MSINRKGEVNAHDIVENEYYHTPDGAKFLKIFSHDIRRNSSLFPPKTSSTQSQLFTTEDNKFSRLKDLPLFKNSDGKYEFLVKYPEYDGCMYSDCSKGFYSSNTVYRNLYGDPNNIVPSIYTRVDYIYGDGSQFIDTGYLMPSSQTATLQIYTKFEYTSLTDYGTICGCQSSGSGNILLRRNPDGYMTFYAVSNTSVISNTVIASTPYYFHATASTSSSSLFSRQPDFINTGSSGSASGTRRIPNLNLCLFDSTNESNGSYGSSAIASIRAQGKMYYFELLWGSTAAIRMYPVVRNSDNVAGMYDVIRKQFYPSSTSTPFRWGFDTSTDIYVDFTRDFMMNFKFKVPQLGKRYLLFGNYDATHYDTFALEVNTSNQLRIWLENSDVVLSSATISANVEYQCFVTYSADNAMIEWTVHGSDGFYTYLGGGRNMKGYGVSSRALKTGTDYRGGNSPFEGLYISKIEKSDCYNRWKQTADPLTTVSDSSQTAESMGYEPVDIKWNQHWYYGVGLAYSPYCFLDCSAGHTDWWCPLGQSHLHAEGTPGPASLVVKATEFYVRVDNYKRLPSMYTQTEYIQTNGTQYIDTGFIPNQNTKIEITFSASGYANGDVYIYGSGVSSGNTAFELYPWSSYLEFNYGSYNTTQVIPAPPANTKVTTVQDRNKYSLTYDGNTYSSSYEAQTFTTPYTLCIAALHRASVAISPGVISIYSCKIWDNDILVRDYIPCYDNMNNGGLYDVVNKKFYRSVTSTEIPRPSGSISDVVTMPQYKSSVNIRKYSVLPDTYQEIEYIESTGSEHINTNIYAGPNTRVVVDYQLLHLDNIHGDAGLYQARVFGSGDTFFYHLYVNGSGNWALAYQDNKGNWINTGVKADYNRYTFDLDGSNKVFTINNRSGNTIASVGLNSISATNTSNEALYLFSYTNSNNFSKARLFRCKIYEGLTLVRDFVPCYRKSDDVAGLFDVVTQTFYSSPTGNFIYKQSKLPSIYQLVEYVETNGSSYINTGIPVNTIGEVLIDSIWDVNAIGVSEGWKVDGVGGQAGYCVYVGYSSNGLAYGNVQQDNVTAYADSLTRRCTYIYKPSGSLQANNNIVETWSLSSTPPTVSWFIGAGRTAASGVSYFHAERIFKYVIKDSSGAIVRNFIPCYRKSDRVAGLYDTVQGGFYRPSSGSLLSGIPILDLDEYDQIDYIEGFGEEYIDTGFSATGGMRALYKARFYSHNYIVGSHNPDSPYGRNGSYVNGDRWEFGYGETCPQVGTGALDTTYEVDFKTTSAEAYLKVRGGVYSDWSTIAVDSGQAVSTLNCYLFHQTYSINRGSPATLAKVWYVRIYDSAGNLVRDFVPVCRKSDKVVGMWDAANAVFYTSVGPKQFRLTDDNRTGNAEIQRQMIFADEFIED